jgi:hypothetical protein
MAKVFVLISESQNEKAAHTQPSTRVDHDGRWLFVTHELPLHV